MSQQHSLYEDLKPIGQHSFAGYIDMATLFHNYPAPGLILGGYMVEEARRFISEGTLFEAISETSWCLPDAIQMLTPCTIGNGWVRVLNLGRYAMSLYDKYTGRGVRVWLDYEKIPESSEIRVWLMKTKAKQEQDSPRLLKEIGMYGAEILSSRPICVRKSHLVKRSKGDIALCPQCGEAYPVFHGAVCRSCMGENPYTDGDTFETVPVFPLPENIRTVQAADALGKKAVHDMTSIIPADSKGAAFRKGQQFAVGDLCRLQQMGKNHLYVEEGDMDESWVHEDDCALAFGHALAGNGITLGDKPHEGKVTLRAACDGLLQVRTDRLHAFNLCTGVMAASRNGWTLVKKGAEIAGTRAIPLYLQQHQVAHALSVLEGEPVFTVHPLHKAKAGLLITGDEIYNGVIEDRFEEILCKKLRALGSGVHKVSIVPDQRSAIAEAAQSMLDAGCDLIITTAGLSVDPDDVTRHGLLDAGAHSLLYGAPILPGAMTLIGHIGNARLLGVPACALFYKNTSLDLLLPRLLAGMEITRSDLAQMGEGSMCLGCNNCTFPKCSFGK